MTPESWELAHVWLEKARSDLATARVLICGAERHLDTGSYHCQQAAEKAIKAWLTMQEIVFPKTHALDALLRLGMKRDERLAAFLPHAFELTPLATEYRYPGDLFEPALEEAQMALKRAGEIVAWMETEVMRVPRPASGGE